MPWIDKNKCIGCGTCINICPVGAISIKNGKAIIDQNKCIKCGKCLDVCSQEAIRPNSENPNLRNHQLGGPSLGKGKSRGFGFGRRSY
jgi:Fe-S-cluster-containing hydrogenase component 2